MWVLVAVGLTLAIGGYALEREEPAGLTRAKAVGLALFVVGVIMLFTERWWWGLIGLALPPLLIDGVLAAIRRR